MLAVVAVAPLWWPFVRAIAQEAWKVSDPARDPDQRGGVRTDPPEYLQGHLDKLEQATSSWEDANWSRRQLTYGPWTSGRSLTQARQKDQNPYRREGRPIRKDVHPFHGAFGRRRRAA